MAEPGFTHVIEIENGIGEPPYLPLTLGHELAPVSIGKEGMWQIQAPSILDVHGYVYYDGASLFVQSADGERPILVDASEVGTTWTSVEAPCRLKLGDIYLRFREVTDEEVESRRFNADDATLVRPDPPVELEEVSESVETIAMPEPPVKPPRPFKPGELVIRNYDDSASTQVADLAQPPPATVPVSGGDTTGATLVRGRVADETQVERTTNPPRRRIAPAPPKPPPGTKAPLARPRAPSMPAAAPPMPPAPPPQPAAPPMQPLAMEPMPPAAMGMTHAMAPAPGIYPPLPPVDPTTVMAPGGPPPTVPPQIQSMPGSPYAPMHPHLTPPARPEPGLNTLMGDFRRFSPVKKAAILAFPFVLVAIFYISYYEPTPKTPEATTPSATAPQASAVVAPHPSQPAPPATQAPVAVQSTAPVQPAAAVDAGGRTLERRAVDAVAGGAYAEAARLYEQLAEAAPNRDEAFKYREAARILRARMDAGAP